MTLPQARSASPWSISLDTSHISSCTQDSGDAPRTKRHLGNLALKGDGRICVHTVKFKALTFTRVMSTVYSPDGSELPNRWRVTNYTLHVIMSAFCYFTYEFGDKERIPIQRRKVADKIIRSSQSTNCLRLWCFLALGTGAVSCWEDSASGRRTRFNFLTSENCSLHAAGLVTLWLAWSMLLTTIQRWHFLGTSELPHLYIQHEHLLSFHP